MSTKSIIIITTAIIVAGSATFLHLKGDSIGSYLHAKSHELGICHLNHGNASLASNQGLRCEIDPQAAEALAVNGLTENEQKVIGYVCDRIITSEGKGLSFTRAEIEKATTVSLDGINQARLQVGVLAELNRRNVDLASLIGSMGNCAQFSACSVNRDLSGATGDELERYLQEKSQDGNTFTDWYAPDFTLPNTADELVSLSDYRGKPVAIVFLSGHCSHSFDTLPIIAELKRKYESQELVVLPVYVNSGSVKNVKEWSSVLSLDFPLIVSEKKDISNSYDSQMVPSTFLIDREGRVTQKLVGYKDLSILDQAFNELASL